MGEYALGDVIAVRKFYLINNEREVYVKIGRPVMDINQKTYYCPYQIVGILDEVVRVAYGIDAVQAIMLVMCQIGAFLYTSKLAKTGILRWEGGGTGVLGFPVTEGLRDIIPSNELIKLYV